MSSSENAPAPAVVADEVVVESKQEELQVKSKGGQWPEIRKAAETKRYELCLVGADFSKRIEDNGGYLDSSLYRLTHLNFLEVAKTKLTTMPRQIGQLVNLTSLLFQNNELTSVPVEIGQLVHLKNLDVSNNKLAQLPAEIGQLAELFTCNLSGNQLSALFPLERLHKLAVLDVSRNAFTRLPDDLASDALENLSQLNASFNQLVELSEQLCELPALKIFNVENNALTRVPASLSQCAKLKELLVKENKLKDNRLKKMVEQDKLKAVIDYLAKAYEEECKSKPKSKTAKAKTAAAKASAATAAAAAATAPALVEYDLVKVLHHSYDESLKCKQVSVASESELANVRPHILCTIIRNVDLESEGNFKKFLAIQTKLHEEKCEKRTLATIATHDLASLGSSLVYEAADPDRIQLVPLGRKNLVFASDYYERLMKEAEDERKAKKRNQLSGVYKYLTLLEGQTTFAYLRDQDKNVLSLPPLTNCEKSRMSPETKAILVEITSSESLDICKQVMEELIVHMLNEALVSNDKFDLLKDSMDALRINSASSASSSSSSSSSAETDEAENADGKLRRTMIVQQVRVLDAKGQLKTVYPSRVDLNFSNSNKFRVIRLYDD